VRVVAGTARGRRLVAPAGTATRPTSDRVREATFNALTSLGAVDGAEVLDLFAGSGAMGIEALSRGATACTFVDGDARAVAAIRANLAATGLDGRARVVRGDVRRFLDGHPGRVGLAVLDPPYALADEVWQHLLDVLDADVAVLESDREVGITDRWETLRVRRYGTTVLSVVERR
jgi:16S rRNA (guanine966-N2)-methyltransferase